MKLLFIFLDGVGLGEDNPDINPLAGSAMPHLEKILEGHKLIADGHHASVRKDSLYVNTKNASLLAVDACLGVEGLPQSASGQASLLTGKNVSAFLGMHEGPKPTPPIIRLLQKGTLFTELLHNGKNASLLNAFPPRYFKAIEVGYRLPGVIALSMQQAGIRLKTADDLFAGEAISADFTAQGWRSALGFSETPILDGIQAGNRLNKLVENTDLAIFEYWLTDIAGHHQDMQAAQEILKTLDTVIHSLVNSWDDENNLILLTSDHGNLEDLSTRHHTRYDVPLLLIGRTELRDQFIQHINQSQGSRIKPDLTDVAPAIINFFGR
jgi:2,3-bisphosphoglycerate-independent phosphoglycerate mutase